MQHRLIHLLEKSNGISSLNNIKTIKTKTINYKELVNIIAYSGEIILLNQPRFQGHLPILLFDAPTRKNIEVKGTGNKFVVKPLLINVLQGAQC